MSKNDDKSVKKEVSKTKKVDVIETIVTTYDDGSEDIVVTTRGGCTNPHGCD